MLATACQRHVLRVRGMLSMMAPLTLLCCAHATPAHAKPNVLLIMTDDQGYGDLGVNGNPIIKTPHLDRLAGESVEVTQFYVSPMCAPTRASLMTGRYNYRTGVVDVWMGRAMMHPDEVTIAEMLCDAGYRTGIFGKWHLGDCYPMRPMDQGFEESLVHTGGGLCQPAGPPDNSYFDPSLLHNGKRVKTKGYCSDVFTDAALQFIERDRKRPFFVYLSFNAPHSPYQVAKELAQPYEQRKLKPDDFPMIGHVCPTVPKATAKVYGMVVNIDKNIGRLLARLDDLGLDDDTIVLFLTDNGPDFRRFNAGFRACKGSVYEGGIRAPFYVRWPARLTAGRQVRTAAAHIDVLPTVLDACDVLLPENVVIDGRSLLPLLEGREVAWSERNLYFQWHWGGEPIRYYSCAVRSGRYKLVNASERAEPYKYHGVPLSEIVPFGNANGIPFELYDIAADPFEMNDLAADHPEIVRKLRGQYDAWFDDVGSTRGYDPIRIPIGTPHENPTILTRQDWRGPDASWKPRGLGCWEILVATDGKFEILCRCDPVKRGATAYFRLQGHTLEKKLLPGTTQFPFGPIRLEASSAERLEVWIVEHGVERPYGVRYVNVRCLP